MMHEAEGVQTLHQSFSRRTRRAVLAAAAAMVLGAAPARASYTAVLNGTTLEVTGDRKSDTLALRIDASGTMLVLDVKNDGTPDFTFDRSLFDTISVSAGKGNDTVIVDESAGQFTDEHVIIDGGEGRDTLIGGLGSDTLIGGDGRDFIDGRRGDDVIFLGAGDDVTVWRPGDGSDTIEGQDGDDRLEFTGANIAESFDIAANGGRVRLFRNVANITMDLDGVEEIDLTTLGGADVVTVNDLTGTDLVLVNADLTGTAATGAGDNQADAVLVNGGANGEVVSIGAVKGVLELDGLFTTVQVEHGEPALDSLSYNVLGPDAVHVLGTKEDDTIAIVPNGIAVRVSVDGFPAGIDVTGGGQLVVSGLGGDDTIVGSNGIAGLGFNVQIDGGKGNDTIIGTDGADVLIGGRGNDTMSGARGNDLLLLGTGSDTAIWNPGDGSDTVEGQAGGSDRLDFRGANIAERIEVAPNGGRVRFTRDVANITMDLDDVEQIHFTALGGADNVIVNDLSGTDVKGVTVDLAATGGVSDGQVDTVLVNGTPGTDKMTIKSDANGVSLARKGGNVRVDHPDPTDKLTVNGLGGGDKIQASPAVSLAMALTINPN